MEKDSINFLPWREAHRARLRKKLAYMVMLSSLMFAALQCAIYVKYRTELNFRTQQLEPLGLKQHTLQQQIKRQQQWQGERLYLSENIKQLQQLHRSQGVTFFLLSAVAATVPEGVVLQQLEKQDEEVSLRGTSESVQLVRRLTDELEKQPYVVSPEVKLISRSATEPAQHSFVLSFTLRLSADSPRLLINNRDETDIVVETRGKVE